MLCGIFIARGRRAAMWRHAAAGAGACVGVRDVPRHASGEHTRPRGVAPHGRVPLTGERPRWGGTPRIRRASPDAASAGEWWLAPRWRARMTQETRGQQAMGGGGRGGRRGRANSSALSLHHRYARVLSWASWGDISV